MSNKFCTKCGKEIQEGQRVCPSCGTPVECVASNVETAPSCDILAVTFACGACGQHIEAPREWFGQITPCPTCGACLQIPDIKTPPPVPPSNTTPADDFLPPPPSKTSNSSGKTHGEKEASPGPSLNLSHDKEKGAENKGEGKEPGPKTGMSAARFLASPDTPTSEAKPRMETNQRPGSQFRLMPGEVILNECRLTLNTIPAATCYVRITNQRLVICQISRWLTIGLSWLCAFIKAKKITLSLTRQDIASATIAKGQLGRKLLVLKCANNSEYQYYPNGFSSKCLDQIVTWWQSGRPACESSSQCGSCGAEIPAGESVCPYCGGTVSDNAGQTAIPLQPGDALPPARDKAATGTSNDLKPPPNRRQTMEINNQGQATPPAIKPKKKKFGCFLKTIVGIVGVLVVLGIIGAFVDDEEEVEGGLPTERMCEPVLTDDEEGGGGKGSWQYTGKEFSAVFSGFPEDEGLVYVHEKDSSIKILQATKNGNLVEHDYSDRVIWVETPGKRYEDGQPLGAGYYVRSSSYEYETALGAEKRVARYVLIAEEKLEPRWKAMAAATKKVLGVGTSAGETKTLALPGGATMEMVWCPAGSFTMGSPEDEEGHDDDENQHHVTLTKGFWMAKTEVTQAQWQSVMGNNPSQFQGDDLPVEKVSWYECQAFCKNAGLELPTEAEWEYACRAGTTGAYAGKLDDMGWYDDNGGDRTHPVGQKRANAWGLQDMHGNVGEWCADWYGGYQGGTVTNPKGASSGASRVLRGGSWFILSAASCRSAARGSFNPSDRNCNLGFRPARVLSE